MVSLIKLRKLQQLLLTAVSIIGPTL